MISISSHRLAGVVLAAVLVSVTLADAGTFKNPALIDTTYDPIGVASADFNHDGNIDLVYIDGVATPTLHILLGRGDATFAHEQDIPLPSGICGYLNCVINLADVTNDGNPDIILGGNGTSTAQIAVLTGNGDGTFNAPTISTLPNSNGNYPSLNTQMGIGDVNGDGALDLVVPDPMGEKLYILLGNGTGKFTLKNALTFYFTGQAIAYLRDLNGDGILDTVVIDRVGGVAHVLMGKGDGTFQASVDYSYLPLLLADIDGDGHPDLVCVQYGQGVTVAKGNSDGTFAAPVSVANVPPNALLAAIRDYNGDGIPDLVFLTPVGISIALGRGSLSYGPLISSVAGQVSTPFFAPAELAPGDLNNDGHNDLAMGVDGGLLILVGNGDGSFASADFYDVGHTVGTAAVADFSGDGKPDIAVTVPATYPLLLLGSGSGAFNLAPDENQSYNSQNPAGSMAVADFNGDGKPDLDILDPSGSPYGQSFVFFDVAGGRFSIPFAINPGATLAADVNNDGRSDLVFLAGGSITTMLGRGNSTFATVTTPFPYASQGVAAIGDLNNDGKRDLLVFEFPNIRIWLGNGDGTFTESNLLNADGQLVVNPETVVIADMDGDGNADIILAPAPDPTIPAQPLLILYGNGDGSFQAPVLLPLTRRYNQVVVADINRDNKPDLVLSDGSGIAPITNLGSRAFSSEDHYVAGQGVSQLSVVDVNGDGFPDIVTANPGGTTITVLLNQPNGKALDGAASIGTFTVTPAPSNYSEAVTLKLVMSAPPGSGTATPTGSLTLYVDGAYITDASLSAGSVSYTYSHGLVPGTHTFVAAYNGDATYSAASFAFLQTVNPPVYATTTTLVASPVTILTSQTVRLKATVTSSVVVPAGWVTFLDGTRSLGAQQVDATGVALLDTATLTAGTHQLSAVYHGYQDPGNLHAIYQPSTSATVTVTANAVATSTAISTSNSSLTAGMVMTLTANVTSGSAVPVGGVSFYDGGTLLGTTSLAAGASTFSTASLSTGSHSIKAVFNANATFALSTSPTLNISITAASANVAPALAFVTIQGNADGKTVLSARIVSLIGSPTGTVTFLDSGKVLGVEMTDSAGLAILPVSYLNGGTHTLSASFFGNPHFAPAVSPEFVEQWPPSGAGFSLDIGRESLTVGAAGSEQVPVKVTAISDFQQSIQFACATGLPTEYRCVFSPASLTGGGTSYLSSQRAEKPFRRTRGSRPAYGIALGFFALLFVIRGGDRRLHCMLCLWMGLSLGILTGCGNPKVFAEHPQMQVLSIRATSGSGAATIIHSAQIIIRIFPEK